MDKLGKRENRIGKERRGDERREGTKELEIRREETRKYKEW